MQAIPIRYWFFLIVAILPFYFALNMVIGLYQMEVPADKSFAVIIPAEHFWTEKIHNLDISTVRVPTSLYGEADEVEFASALDTGFLFELTVHPTIHDKDTAISYLWIDNKKVVRTRVFTVHTQEFLSDELSRDWYRSVRLDKEAGRITYTFRMKDNMYVIDAFVIILLSLIGIVITSLSIGGIKKHMQRMPVY